MPMKARKPFFEESRTTKNNNNSVAPRSTSKVLLALKNDIKLFAYNHYVILTKSPFYKLASIE